MKLAIALIAFTALINTAEAQTSATVLVQDSTYDASAYGFLSTSFVGLKLPSGGGSVSLTIAPGDSADQNYVSSWADHTQSGPYIDYMPSTVVSISATGHYWMYLSGWGGNYNYDWLEIRVEASTYSGTPTCYYCAPPSGWTSGWPPVASHQETGVFPASQPASRNPNILVPRWVLPVLAVVIALATLLPISYCLYRRHRNKCALSAASPSDSSAVELQSTSVDSQRATAV